MPIPANASAALAARSILVGSWLEIEGIPYAYGTFTASASHFSARGATSQFLGIKPQLTTLPKLVGQTIDTLKGGNLSTGQAVFEILDKDGQPNAWAGNVNTGYKLAASVTSSATSWTLNSAAGLAINQYLYVGSETVKITNIVGNVLTVTRAMFRTTAKAYPGFFPVDTSPTVMANRRCWFYQVFDSASRTIGTFSSLTIDDDKVLRFAGQLTQYHLKDNDPTVFVLSAESVDRELDRPAFRNLRQFRLSGTSIKDGQNSGSQPCQVAGWPGYTSGYEYLHNFDGADFTLNERMLLQIDDEVFVGEVSSVAPGKMKLVARALFGSRPEIHKEGAIVREIVPVVAKSNQTVTGQNANWGEIISKFNALPVYAGDVGPDHPVILALTVLCSTGLGTNFGVSTRNCDRLPAEWGMGLSHERVDWTACEAAAREEPALRFSGIVNEPINAMEFVRSMLTFAGYYFTITTGDYFTIKRLRPPLPDETTRSITNSERIRGFFPSWDANWSGAIRQLHFKFGYDILTGKFKRVTIFTLNDADIYSKGLARTVELSTRFVYPGGSNIPGDLLTRAFDVDMWLLQRSEYFKQRYGKPPPIIKERVNYSFLDCEVGDIVSITNSNLPLRGARGMSGVLGEVIAKEVDDAARVIDLTVLMTGDGLGDFCYIAPSIVADFDGNTLVDAGTHWRIEDINLSHTGFDASNGGSDAGFETQGGTPWDWSSESKVLLVSADFSDYETVNIISFNGSNLEFDYPAGFTFAAGDIVTLAPAFDSPSYLASPFFAAFADGGDLNGETPQTYFPA